MLKIDSSKVQYGYAEWSEPTYTDLYTSSDGLTYNIIPEAVSGVMNFLPKVKFTYRQSSYEYNVFSLFFEIPGNIFEGLYQAETQGTDISYNLVTTQFVNNNYDLAPNAIAFTNDGETIGNTKIYDTLGYAQILSKYGVDLNNASTLSGNVPANYRKKLYTIYKSDDEPDMYSLDTTNSETFTVTDYADKFKTISTNGDYLYRQFSYFRTIKLKNQNYLGLIFDNSTNTLYKVVYDLECNIINSKKLSTTVRYTGSLVMADNYIYCCYNKIVFKISRENGDLVGSCAVNSSMEEIVGFDIFDTLVMTGRNINTDDTISIIKFNTDFTSYTETKMSTVKDDFATLYREHYFYDNKLYILINSLGNKPEKSNIAIGVYDGERLIYYKDLTPKFTAMTSYVDDLSMIVDEQGVYIHFIDDMGSNVTYNVKLSHNLETMEQLDYNIDGYDNLSSTTMYFKDKLNYMYIATNRAKIYKVENGYQSEIQYFGKGCSIGSDCVIPYSAVKDDLIDIPLLVYINSKDTMIFNYDLQLSKCGVLGNNYYSGNIDYIMYNNCILYKNDGQQSGPISQEEYVTALDTANDIKGGNV